MRCNKEVKCCPCVGCAVIFGVKTDPGASSLTESVIGPFRLVGVAGVPALVLRTFCSGFGGSHKVSGPVSIIQLFRQRLSHESVKAYATMPIGIMGRKSLTLID